MAGFNFGSIASALADTKGSGVSFESQANKWETEEQGLNMKTFEKDKKKNY